jgi:pyrroloquinoline quinone (PQQ) biosynthesis protein C
MAALSGEQFATQLKADLEARKAFRNHPWIKKFERGELTKEQVRTWVEQQYYVTGHDGHILLSAMLGKAPNDKIRQEIIENIIEETTGSKIEGSAPHNELYIRLGEALESSREKMTNLEPLPEALALRSYWELMMVTHSFAEGMAAGSLGGEAQLPGNAARFAKVLEEKYGLSHEQTAFWWVHEQADMEHGDAAFRFVASLCTTEEEQKKVRATLRRSLELAWLFFDGLEKATSEMRKAA